MKAEEQIKDFIAGLAGQKRSDIEALNKLIRKVLPKGKLWFLNGKDSENKTVSNPNIGYGSYTIKYADGTSREFYQVGLSPNTTGVSVYIMGIKDKAYLAKTYGDKMGKAKVTGYCIKFKTLKDIHLDVLEEAIRFGVKDSVRE